MKVLKTLCGLLGLSVALSACNKQEQVAHETASKVFTNAKVYTVNEKQPWAEAVAIKDNKIIFVGDAEGAKAYTGENTETLDLQGKMLMPGFVSGHDHLVAAEWMFDGMNLYPATTKEETFKIIKDYVAAHPDEPYYFGMGWNDAFIGYWPTAAELDELIPNKPAVLVNYTIHEGWMNSKAMELAGFNKDTPDGIPGVSYLMRDKDGNPTGTGIEFAWAPAYVAMGAWQPEKIIPSSQKNLYGLAVKNGYTTAMMPGIVTPNILYAEPMFADYRIALKYLHGLEEKGELQLRTMLLPMYKHPDTDTDKFVKDTLALREQYNSDMLRIESIKVHPEGTWSGHSVLMVEPFADKPDSHGSANIYGDKMKEIILAANKAGLDVHTHVEGDGSARNWIDAVEVTKAAGNTDARNSLQHLIQVTPSDLERIKKLNIPANVTPLFSIAWGGQDVGFHQLLGDERVGEEVSMYPELFDNGNIISMSADMPGSPPEYMGPLMQIAIAMTHQDPYNAESPVYPPGRKGISLEQGIKAVTINPAWQMRMEDKIGSLEVGKYADLVILDKNLFNVPVEEIHKVKVQGTILNGEFSYRDGI